ncbi:MAG: hypothetical protein QOE82_3094, partial [Thermoanaerobaculia bacterium]|nr:hypothetical protein [Thermoanaerobaculia bacterium]
VSDDLSHAGLINVDDWDEEELRARGVTTFTRIAAGDAEMHDKLGI